MAVTEHFADTLASIVTGAVVISMSSVVLTAVTEAGHWRVKMEWLDSRHAPRYFGKFNSESEAKKWIAEHHSLTTQREDAR